jgi:hypothetical protein
MSQTSALGGKEGQQYHQTLNEEQSQQGDVELIWEREQQRLKAREATEDKFATLFEPPTPRASPTLLPSSLPPAIPPPNCLSLIIPTDHTQSVIHREYFVQVAFPVIQVPTLELLLRRLRIHCYFLLHMNIR